MSKINKVPASAGAYWLLGGFALLRRAPLGLASVSMAGFFLMLLAILLGVMVMAATTQVPFPLSLLPLAVYCLLTLGVPSFAFAGVIWAAREVAQGRPALPQHLYKGFSGRRARALLVTSLPQLVGTLFVALMLMALVGSEGVQQILQVLEKLQALAANGAQPDPAQVQALVATLPAARILLWVLLALATAPLVVCVLLLAVPQIVFSDSHGFAALRASIVANLRNLPAMLVFVLLLALVVFAVSTIAQLAGVLVQALLGPAMAVLVANLLLVGVLMPLLAGTAYHAWHQIFEGEVAAEPPPPPGAIVA